MARRQEVSAQRSFAVATLAAGKTENNMEMECLPIQRERGEMESGKMEN